jgi:hypothetical protein
MKSLFILLAMVIGSSAFASREAGNGGDALVCTDPNDGKVTVTMYDYYEAEAKFGMQLELGDASKAPVDLVSEYIDRLRAINPSRADLYRHWLSQFFSEANLLPGIRLVDVPDTGEGYYPENCEMKQIAVQKIPKFPGEKRYTVSKDLWDQMDNRHKAALILHELVLRDAVGEDSGNTNSVNARYFHGMIMANALRELSLQQYHELLQVVQLAWADTHDGIPFRLFKVAAGKTVPTDFAYANENQMRYVPYDQGPIQWGVALRRTIGGRELTLDFSLPFVPRGSWSTEMAECGPEQTRDRFCYFANGLVDALPIQMTETVELTTARTKILGRFDGIGFTREGAIATLWQFRPTSDPAYDWEVSNATGLNLTLRTSVFTKHIQFRDNGSITYLDAEGSSPDETDPSLSFRGVVKDPVNGRNYLVSSAFDDGKSATHSDRLIWLSEENQLFIGRLDQGRFPLQGQDLALSFVHFDIYAPVPYLKTAVLREPARLQDIHGAYLDVVPGSAMDLDANGLVVSVREAKR